MEKHELVGILRSPRETTCGLRGKRTKRFVQPLSQRTPPEMPLKEGCCNSESRRTQELCKRDVEIKAQLKSKTHSCS